MGGCSDSRELLDRSIYEYLLKKKLPITAEIFALETRISTTPIVGENTPDGLLSQWWDCNYDMLSDRLRNYSNSEGASSSRNPVNEPQCRSSMQMPTPLHQPQKIRSIMMPQPQLLNNLSLAGRLTSEMAGLSYSPQTVMPSSGNFLQSGPSTIMPTPGLVNPQRTASPTMMPTPGLPIPPSMMPTPGLVNPQQTAGPIMMPTPGLPIPPSMMPTPGLVNPQPTAGPTTMPTPGLPIPPSMMPTPGLPNSQQTSCRTMMPTSDLANLQQSVTSTITPTPDQLNQDRFGTIPSPNFNVMLGQTMTNWIAARIHEQETLVLPVARLFDVNLLVYMLTSVKKPEPS